MVLSESGNGMVWWSEAFLWQGKENDWVKREGGSVSTPLFYFLYIILIFLLFSRSLVSKVAFSDVSLFHLAAFSDESNLGSYLPVNQM